MEAERRPERRPTEVVGSRRPPVMVLRETIEGLVADFVRELLALVMVAL